MPLTIANAAPPRAIVNIGKIQDSLKRVVFETATRLLAIGVVAGFIAWWWMGGCYKVVSKEQREERAAEMAAEMGEKPAEAAAEAAV
ncbi:hypothetical protein AK812_SmicGene42490 [Symbiodinium microadriaticum]|uniref:Uncharacterized protein n=1 Tax=Symbiodinium microadriaticum TaxID=2951 RepID=A0A1Q9C3F3_SYMMI|nr:hypothetical protein AK812_SmicGene42490 [Symbiodinium microadriaticum]